MNLHLICGKDDLRPAMGYVFVTRETMVATDANVLGVIPTKERFDQEFIDQIPEEGMLIHREDWKNVATCDQAVWKTQGVIRLRWVKKRDVLIEVADMDEVGKYPNWQAVVPDEMVCDVELAGWGFDAILALSLQKALGFTGLNLSFSGRSRGARVTDVVSDEMTENRYGLLMPRI